MRWPIRLQLLVPMVSVVLLASLLATAITAYWIALRVRREQRESLRRVVETLAEAAFPLNEQVLRQMEGLSGAEFVLMTPAGALRQNTVAMPDESRAELLRVAAEHTADDQAAAERDQPIVVFLAGHSYLVEFVRIQRRAHFTEASLLFILYAEDRLASRIRQAVTPALIAGLVAAFIAVGIASWLAQRFARPIHTLVARTAAIAQGDFTPMALSARNDELRDLSQSINHMTAQLADYEQRVRHNERLKTLGQLGASMAHQLRNAATGGRMAIELHRRECSQGDSDESLDVALRQLRLMESYLRQFLTLDESKETIRERLNMTLLVEDVLNLLRPSYVHAGIDFTFAPPAETILLDGDPAALRQLVTNLVINAIDAAANASSDRRVTVHLKRMNAYQGAVQVEDTGPGLDPGVVDRLFHRFVTTKRDGFGLGLFVARQIAERHGGQLGFERVAEITRFTFEFPLATA